MNISDIIDLMEKKQVARKRDLVGVPLPEITKAEAAFGLSFPLSYKQYLNHFGRSAGYLSTWLAIYFDDLKEIQEEFEFQQLCKEVEVPLPPNALLIANMGTAFDYLLCDDSENPSVFRIELGDTECSKEKLHSDSFTQYLEKLVLSANTHEMQDYHVDPSGNIRDGDMKSREDLGEDVLQSH